MFDARCQLGPRWRLAAVLASAAALACGEEPPPQAPVARPVKIVTLGSEGATRVLEYPGEIEASQHADLAFEVAGQVVEFPVEEGQDVQEGQVLAKLDPRDYQARLDAELARRNAARAEYERQQALFDADVASQQELERVRRDYEVNEANLRTSRKALEDTQLRAPFAGKVARKLVKDFRNVQAKEPVLILQDDSDLQIVVHVPEADLALGQPDITPAERAARIRPRVTVSSFPDRVFPATLREVATTADPATRTYAVTLHFEKPGDLNILSGMTAKVTLEVPDDVTGAGYAVPVQAVLNDQGSTPYVWRVDPETMTVGRATVTLGEVSGDHIEVTGGLDPGDQVAVSGVHRLREGMPVRRFQN